MRTLHPMMLALLIMACGDTAEAPASSEGEAHADAHATGETESDASGEARLMDAVMPPGPAVTPCPTGQVPGADGTCMPVGIQGCADMFIDPLTGLCDPSPDDCSPGHIPIFNEGCQSVSIPGCVEEFMDPETGLCDPSPEDCPPGHIPVISKGCVRVGVVDCHPDFIDPVTGHCDPDPDACEPYHIPVPTEGCVSLDPPGGCGEGTWGNLTLMDGDVHVDLAYAGGDSDGSREAPFTLIKDATDVVIDGGRVVLAAGDYPEGVRITKSFALVGRCASMVTLSGAKATVLDFDAVIRVNKGVQAGISDLSASGPGAGILAYEDVSLTVSRVALVENQIAGVGGVGAATTIAINDVLIARTQPSPTGTYGYGVQVQQGATIAVARGALIDNHGVGLSAFGEGTRVDLSDVVIARTQVAEGGVEGLGVDIHQAATLTLTKSVLTDNRMLGLNAQDAGTEVEVREARIARTQPNADGFFGRGVNLDAGAALTMSKSVVEDHHDLGIAATASSTTAELEEVLVARTQPIPDGRFGRGVGLQLGAQLTMKATTLMMNHDMGLFVGGDESNATVQSAVIAHTQPRPDGTSGRGANVELGATLTLSHCALTDNHDLGLFVSDNGSAVEADALLIARTQPQADGTHGRGINIQTGAAFTLRRSAIIKNQAIGIYIGTEGTTADVTDSLIAQTLSRADGSGGRGVNVQNGAALTLHRSALVRNRELGIFVGGVGAMVEVADTLIAQTHPKVGGVSGRGVTVQQGATCTLSKSAMLENHEAGVSVLGGTITISESLISATQLSEEESGFGDGLLISNGFLDLSGSISRDNARGGILIWDSQGSLRGTMVTGNAVGLATQGAIPADLMTGNNVFEGNIQDIVSDELFTVPELRTDTPTVPDFER